MLHRTVGIIGYGHFGAFVHTILKRFAPSIRVRVFSRHNAPDGTAFFSLEETAQCDAVILAVPIHAFEEVLMQILPLISKNTILVDVATVKVHTVQILKRLAVGMRYVAIHPMFGPESYAKKNEDISGFRIVVTDHTLTSEEHAQIHSYLTTLGFTVLEMSAEIHDRNLAETLFLTHFIGQIVSHAGFVRTDIDTVSFGYLMDAVESVKHDTNLFRDVFDFNPFCKEVLARFSAAEIDVKQILSRDTETLCKTSTGVV